MNKFTIDEINNLVKGELLGTTNEQILGLEEIEKAQKNQITFIGNKKYANLWKSSKACAAIVSEGLNIEPMDGKALIKVKNADLAMAVLLEIFHPEFPEFSNEIHSTAIIHETVVVGEGCKIGAGCYVGKNVVLGAGTVLYPNVTIFDNSSIGKNTTIWSGTVIRERSEIGNDCIVGQYFSCHPENHNYQDRKSLIRLQGVNRKGIQIGDNCWIGSKVTILDGVKIGSGSIIAAGCVVNKSFPANSIIGGVPAKLLKIRKNES